MNVFRTPPPAPVQVRGDQRAGQLVDQLVALVRGLMIQMEVKHVAPPSGVLDDEGDFDMPIDFALIPNQLLPIIVEQARLVYAEAWFDRSGGQPFTFDIEADVGGQMGIKVVAVRGGAPFPIAALCVTDAVMEFATRNPPSRGILTLG